jgi:hypothetical protein
MDYERELMQIPVTDGDLRLLQERDFQGTDDR